MKKPMVLGNMLKAATLSIVGGLICAAAFAIGYQAEKQASR